MSLITASAHRSTAAPFSRRGFLNTTLAVCPALVTGGAPWFARALGANDQIRIGVIGIGSTVKIGGKGKADIRDWRKTAGVKVVALCDVDKTILVAEADQFDKWGEKLETFRGHDSV